MNIVLFIISAVLSAAVYYLSLKNADSDSTSRLKKYLPLLLSLGLIVFSVLGFMKIFDPGQFADAWFFMAFFVRSDLLCFISGHEQIR
ncbi:hypothetical protein [Ruminococcus sp. HUN007]|uniref:hypothetical protein n=1 Tax=Ruminococcus sp. HUN007 TaxID=1514668 RepID=UPI0005D1AAA7|nr:hypothetical protein [Ruminococcus sp. HUN007]